MGSDWTLIAWVGQRLNATVGRLLGRGFQPL